MCSKIFILYAATLSIIPRIALSEPVVVGYELVSKVRVTRTKFDYVYKVNVDNVSPAFENVTLTVSSNDAATETIDPNVYLAFVGELSTVLSDDGFTIRQDRTQPFRMDSLIWEVTGTPVVMSGDPLEISDISLVETRGSPEHAGPLPVDGNPISGQSAGLRVTLSGPLLNGHVELLDISDRLLESATLEPNGRTESVATNYLASMVVPRVPFRVRVRGADSSGRPVDKLWGSPFFPVELDVDFVESHQSGPGGASISIPVRVTNYAGAQVFRLSTLSVPTSTIVLPAVPDFELATLESRVVDLSIVLPSDLDAFSSVRIRVMIVGLSDARVINSSFAEIEVTP